MNGKVMREREFLDRVGGAALLVGGGKDPDHIIAALEKALQDGFAKGLLAVNQNSHIWILLYGVGRMKRRNFIVRIAKHVAQHFVGMFAKQRRALDLDF